MNHPSLLYNDDANHGREIAANSASLMADLNLRHVLDAMSQGDPFIRQVSKETILGRERLSVPAILHRQEILRDFMQNPTACLRLHDTLSNYMGEYETRLAKSLPSFSTFISASAVIKDRIILLRILIDCVQRTKEIIGETRASFVSGGVTVCFRAYTDFFTDKFITDALGYLGEIESASETMYACISAGLGRGFKGDCYVLRSITQDRIKKTNPERAAKSAEISLSSIGIQAQAGKLRDAALSQVSHVLKEVIDQTLEYLRAFRHDVAFFAGCIHLSRKLAGLGVPLCFPSPAETGCGSMVFGNLVDISLAIENSRCPVGNTLGFDACRLLVVTGANQGGKSTFIRSFGCAQLLMQCGMFVGAEAFSAGLSSGIHTHFCRPESTRPDQGRLHEELNRMSEIVEHMDRDSLVLMNESFSTTSEHEASAIAGEVLQAFFDAGVRSIYVTHFFEFARMMREKNLDGVKFLVAQRNADGSRPYTLAQSQPQRTSFALDIYREVFGNE